MDKKEGWCEVKGCNNKSDYILMTHEDEDREICKKCADKYFNRKD